MVHPCPALSGPVLLTSAASLASGTRAEVHDAVGRAVVNLALPGMPAGGAAVLDLSGLAPGNYRLRVDGLAGSAALVITR